jgi:hypothetical protein
VGQGFCPAQAAHVHGRLMEIFRFSARIRLYHPTMAPDVISSGLNKTASRQWKAGDIRRRPDGTEIGGTYKETYWCSEAAYGEDAELLQIMNADLDQLETVRQFVGEFVSTGGRIEYYISWFASDRSGGEILHYESLRRLALLGISIALDVYSSGADYRSGRPADPKVGP